mmetsp:Transcript_2109/g.7638  ORF Transcript_2109/g.7638 Transcript_2109/m.7638 type:complete len:205 (+) Transcript_2109:1731-2345(+)
MRGTNKFQITVGCLKVNRCVILLRFLFHFFGELSEFLVEFLLKKDLSALLSHRLLIGLMPLTTPCEMIILLHDFRVKLNILLLAFPYHDTVHKMEMNQHNGVLLCLLEEGMLDIGIIDVDTRALLSNKPETIHVSLQNSTRLLTLWIRANVNVTDSRDVGPSNDSEFLLLHQSRTLLLLSFQLLETLANILDNFYHVVDISAIL